MRYALLVLFALSMSSVGGVLATLLAANVALNCQTYDRELWTDDSRCVFLSDLF